MVMPNNNLRGQSQITDIDDRPMVVWIPCMARPLRYEAAGAVYHVMARGDGGKNVFEEDKDRFAWTDLLEKSATSGPATGPALKNLQARD